MNGELTARAYSSRPNRGIHGVRTPSPTPVEGLVNKRLHDAGRVEETRFARTIDWIDAAPSSETRRIVDAPTATRQSYGVAASPAGKTGCIGHAPTTTSQSHGDAASCARIEAVNAPTATAHQRGLALLIRNGNPSEPAIDATATARKCSFHNDSDTGDSDPTRRRCARL